MDKQRNIDFFEEYIDRFPNCPSLVIVRSVELKYFPYEYLKEPIIDLCCGDGFFFDNLSKWIQFKQAYGCDINEKDILSAKAKGIYKDVKCEDIRKLKSYENSSFSSAISNCALEHIDGIKDALRNISRILQKEAFFVATVPSINLIKWFPRKFRLLSYNQRQMHRNLLTIEEWKDLFDVYGLKVEKYFYLFNEQQYKIAIYFDALPDIVPKIFYPILKYFIIALPKSIKKLIWRKYLKPIYIDSKPNSLIGGELVIVARKYDK